MIKKRWNIEEDEPLQIVDSKGEYEAVCVLYSEDAPEVMNLLNDLYNENERLKKHIKANTLKKIKVEDVFNCAKYDKFYNNKEAIKSIDWIAEQLGVDLE